MATVLDTRSQATIVGNIAAGAQGRISTFLNFAVGSVFLAIGEAYAGVCMWLQKVNTQILALTRAATSDDDDLDTWMADFKLARLPASPSSGVVTFGIYSLKNSATIIPVGATVKTADGSLIFTVYADPTNGSYRADLGGYLLAAGTSSVDVPVICSTAGTVGNVTAGAINTIAAQVPADTVVNAAGFTNGLDPEKDADLRVRFWAYMASLSQGTEAAYRFAITSVQQGLRIQYVSAPGLVSIWIDDGSGSPSDALIAACQQACDAVRAGGTQCNVYGASRIAANVSLIVTIDTNAGYVVSDVMAQVEAALAVYINAIPEGGTLPWARIGAVAFAASPGVTNVTSVLLNGTTNDLVAGTGQTIKANNIVASPATPAPTVT